MKHAYLIIAHHEFEILKKLVQAIDDERPYGCKMGGL